MKRPMPKPPTRRMTPAQDDAADKRRGIREGSARDNALDRKRGVPVKRGKR